MMARLTVSRHRTRTVGRTCQWGRGGILIRKWSPWHNHRLAGGNRRGTRHHQSLRYDRDKSPRQGRRSAVQRRPKDPGREPRSREDHTDGRGHRGSGVEYSTGNTGDWNRSLRARSDDHGDVTPNLSDRRPPPSSLSAISVVGEKGTLPSYISEESSSILSAPGVSAIEKSARSIGSEPTTTTPAATERP